MSRLKVIQKIGAVVAIVGLSGCASYTIGGTFEDTGQPFMGDVTIMIGDIGLIKVATVDGKVTCEGDSRVTSRPSGYTTVGAHGTASAKCDDGRSFKVDFIQTEASGGIGKGIDSNGNIVKVYFDRSEEVVEDQLKMERLNNLIK